VLAALIFFIFGFGFSFGRDGLAGEGAPIRIYKWFDSYEMRGVKISPSVAEMLCTKNAVYKKCCIHGIDMIAYSK